MSKASITNIPTRAKYIAMLKAHDWMHEFSDSHPVYLRGYAERKELEHAAAILDPGFVLWNAHAPEDFQRKA